MNTLKISKKTAKRLYPDTPTWFQEVLNENFGSDLFAPQKYTDIKTFDDACRTQGTTEQKFNERFKNLGLDPDTIYYEMLKIVVAAINQEWTADWNNSNQYKWWPYFKMSSGFGFSGSGYDCTYSRSSVGSRLCFESEEKSNYAAKQFIDIYKGFLTINN